MQQNKLRNELKQWMKDNQLWNEMLFNQLIANNMYSVDSLYSLSNEQINYIISMVKNDTSRILHKFQFDIRNKQIAIKEEKRKARKIKKDIKNKNELICWMKETKVWSETLFNELIKNNIKSIYSLRSVTNDKIYNILCKVRMDKYHTLDTKAQNKFDKLLVKFEKKIKTFRKREKIQRNLRKKMKERLITKLRSRPDINQVIRKNILHEDAYQRLEHVEYDGKFRISNRFIFYHSYMFNSNPCRNALNRRSANYRAFVDYSYGYNWYGDFNYDYDKSNLSQRDKDKIGNIIRLIMFNRFVREQKILNIYINDAVIGVICSFIYINDYKFGLYWRKMPVLHNGVTREDLKERHILFENEEQRLMCKSNWRLDYIQKDYIDMWYEYRCVESSDNLSTEFIVQMKFLLVYGFMRMNCKYLIHDIVLLVHSIYKSITIDLVYLRSQIPISMKTKYWKFYEESYPER